MDPGYLEEYASYLEAENALYFQEAYVSFWLISLKYPVSLLFYLLSLPNLKKSFPFQHKCYFNNSLKDPGREKIISPASSMASVVER